jgi:hypothetical protein
MRESTTAQKTLRESRNEGWHQARNNEVRRFALRLGAKPFAEAVATLQAIQDVDRF